MARFTDIFIRRPVLASVVSLIILLVGLQAAWRLPIRQFPEITKTTITVTTGYPGANADQIKGFITTPLQQAVGFKVIPTAPVQQGRRCCFDDDDVGVIEMRKKLPARLFVASLDLSEAEHCCEGRVCN